MKTISDELTDLLARLEEEAALGRYEISIGDFTRCELSDQRFNEIVPKDKEDKVIQLMFDSGKWNRLPLGFSRKREILSPEHFVECFQNDTVLQDVKVLQGRIIRGHSDEDFEFLSNDPNRKLVYVLDCDGMEQILSASSKSKIRPTYNMLKIVGYDESHIKRLHESAIKFKLVVFDIGQTFVANWDGLLGACVEIYPELKESCDKYRDRLKNTPFSHFEVMAGFSFGDHDDPGDPEFMTYEKWLSSPRSFLDLRRFLYHTVHVRELYRGDGYAESNGEKVREYLMPNQRISDISGAQIVDLPELELP